MLLALLGFTWQTVLSTRKTMNRSAAQQEHNHVQQHVSSKEGSEPALVRQKATLGVVNTKAALEENI